MTAAPRLGQDQLKILLVDDNIFIRNLISHCLGHMGFSGLRGFSNGIQAIEFIKPAVEDEDSQLAKEVGQADLIISDLIMPQLNGIQLLHWVRTNKDSPNRFMPFIMISGAADQKNVHEARDAGANEFVAKPFTIGSVFSRIQAVIDRPRQFVATRKYFGPDRRRVKIEIPENGPKDRRRPGEDHATVVYSADKVERKTKGSDTYLFKLPNILKQKMGLHNSNKPFEMPTEILAEAEDTLEREAEGFLDWAKTFLDDLSDKVAQAQKDAANRAGHLAEVNRIAHELRGQGGTFGYPLITLIAKSLYETTEYPCREDDANLKICVAHIDTLRAVIREKIEGDGGAIGRQLLSSLNQAIAKYSSK
ncbi:MAG: response regulator [Rhodospirillaceae bacterium]|jgi:CheY-like chemotaxis protein|nr:response regulator [Rhodospirillaceae bacterium]MBT5565480.1 response regulator [Rhodospirillaceae bacterium]MBT6089810.1 response regulator [Rhodospirillaceae bacterium]MBT6961678.1 response regulator [Rhodospirillaceae bacterium]MBT7451131.1 response regulator [Rhodospirillaceae bacterium]